MQDVPKTSVGKFDKKVLRARYAAGQLNEIVYSSERSDRECQPVPDPGE